MNETWKFKTVRSDGSRRLLRRQNGQDGLIGTHDEALDFAARAQAYLLNELNGGLARVEAWSCGRIERDPSDPPRTVFKIRPHENGRDWRADETELHHGGWYLALEPAIDYALFRGAGRVCEVEIWNAAGELTTVVLADLRGHDAVPYLAPKT